jgi:hypothetical protein
MLALEQIWLEMIIAQIYSKYYEILCIKYTDKISTNINKS